MQRFKNGKCLKGESCTKVSNRYLLFIFIGNYIFEYVSHDEGWIKKK